MWYIDHAGALKPAPHIQDIEYSGPSYLNGLVVPYHQIRVLHSQTAIGVGCWGLSMMKVLLFHIFFTHYVFIPHSAFYP